ncbi:hypothetical protein PFNF135_00690 [Plasmodium falciparum NF135/5.C10]|uniref:Plasmodium RESA N-terminal domain-containing protein n=1 Tax=Plasmodium falciparum NF135/5.C10 TaxID=1036726 RepID=W4IP49_PLAFA|nr:hypothetical protein PFNF135_00690 [Plasmodium falciparum NF135/5.C10]
MCNKLSRGSNMNKSELGDRSTKMKGKICSSYVKYICLTICVIGMLCIKLRDKYEGYAASGIQNNNVYLRNLSELQKGNQPCLRHTNRTDNSKMNKVKNNNQTENNDNKKKLGNKEDNQGKNKNNNNKEKQNDINKRGTQNTETKKSNKKLSQDYNDVNKKFTKEQMKNLVNSLDEIPPRNDMEKIWNHAVKTANSGTSRIKKKLKEYEQKYGRCYEERPNRFGSYEQVLIRQPHEFNERLKVHENDYTVFFYELLDKDPTLDEIKNYITSFLEGFQNLIDFLFNKYKIIFLQTTTEIPIEGTIYDTSKKDMKKNKNKKQNIKQGGKKEEVKQGGKKEVKQGGKKEEVKQGGKKEEVKKELKKNN